MVDLRDLSDDRGRGWTFIDHEGVHHEHDGWFTAAQQYVQSVWEWAELQDDFRKALTGSPADDDGWTYVECHEADGFPESADDMAPGFHRLGMSCDDYSGSGSVCFRLYPTRHVARLKAGAR